MSENNIFIHNKWEAMHIDLIKETAEEIWGDNIIFGEIEDLGAPWAEFEWPVRIYSFSLKFLYDRSIFGVAIPSEDGDIMFRNIAKEPLFTGFESLKPPQNLYHNLKVLDRYLLQKMSEEE